MRLTTALVLMALAAPAAAQTIPQVTTTCTPGPSKDDCPAGFMTFCTVLVHDPSAPRPLRRMWSPRPATCGTLRLGDSRWTQLGCSCVLDDLPAERRKGQIEYR